MATSKADATLFINGRILTRTSAGRDDEPTFADSMLVQDGLIKAVGSLGDLPVGKDANIGDVTTVDLGRKTVLPGFIDGHVHLLQLGHSLAKVSLVHCKGLADIRATIKAFAEANPDAPRVLAKDWMRSMTPEGVSAADLDDLDSRPIIVDTKDLHFAWCNTPALYALDVMDITEDPPGGTIQRGPDGKPNGVFGEGAVLSIIWPRLAMLYTFEERKESIAAAIENYHTNGYTGLVDMAMDEPAWESLTSLAKDRPDLNMRIAAYWLMKPVGTIEERLKQLARAREVQKQYNAETSPDLRVVGIKIVCDGIIDACTAFLGEPYNQSLDSDKPAPSAPPVWTPEDLDPVIKAASDAGMQIALHAIGDAAIKMAVDALEKHGSRGRRHRIEHLELASPEDAKRLGELEITASIQPVHADPAILRNWPRLLGEDRCGRAFAYREMADSGALVALGSDSPTAPWQPLRNVYVATTRRSAREEDYDKVVNEHFRLGLCESVVAASKGASMSVFDEKRTGTLEVGKKADFVVVDMEWEAKQLLKSEVLETWFDGKKVY
ncbi:amidohydrolase 3 [Sarocladium strictum]